MACTELLSGLSSESLLRHLAAGLGLLGVQEGNQIDLADYCRFRV